MVLSIQSPDRWRFREESQERVKKGNAASKRVQMMTLSPVMCDKVTMAE